MWRTVKLGDVCDVLDKLRKPITKKDRVSGDIPYYGATGVVDWVADFIFNEKLVLVGEDGAKWSVGDATAFIVEGKAWVNNHAHVLRPHEGTLLHEWLAYYLTAIDLSPWVTGLTVPKLNQAQLRSIPIPLPPLAEQQRIVAKLDAAFAEIDEAVRTNLVQARNAKSLFESSRATFLSANSEDWAEKSLGDCCSRVSVGHVGSTSEYYCAEELGIPFLRSQNVKPARLELDSVRFITKAFHEKLKKSQLKANDILIVRVGANRGDCCLVPANVEKLNCANIVFARPVEGHPSFLAHFCQSTIGRQRLMGMTTGAAQGVINTKSVATLRIPFPPLEQQRTIARKLDEINERAIELEAIYRERAHQTRLLKSAILAQELQPQQSEAA